jgi:LPS-assembly protein
MFANRSVRAFPMTSRTRFLITAALVCHLLIAHPLVTSQLLSAIDEKSQAEKPSASWCPLKPGEDGACALTQEKVGDVYKLRGNAEIHYGAYVLHADEATYDAETGDVTVEGHVVLEGGPYDEHVEADQATYNVKTETGRFEHVKGTIGLQMRGSGLVLDSSNPFLFRGSVVEKTGPRRYVVYNGSVTTCELPKPKWQFNAHKIVVDAGANAQIYHSDFRIMGVPVFYLPYATHPIEKVRESGLSIPDLGTSSTKGRILGESIYWVINRSIDAQIGGQYYSSRGWAPHAEIRARPSETSFIDLNYSEVIDRGGPQGQNQGGTNVRLEAMSMFPHNLRGVATVDYLTSYLYRLAFTETFTQAVNSEVKSQAYLSHTAGGFFNNISTERYQNFESTAAGNVITITHAPNFELSSVDRPFGHSPFYWSYDAEAGGLSRGEPGFHTPTVVARLDLNPGISLPLLLHGWSLRPALTLHETVYTEGLVPSTSATGVTATGAAVNRKALEGAVEVRPPSLERVFDREILGRKWKHVVEPRAVYRYVTGVNNFDNILRFDERDILSDTNEVEYGVVNRIYAKRTSILQPDCAPAGMPGLILGGTTQTSVIPWERKAQVAEGPCQAEPQVREVFTWELAQKYYLDPTFGGALVPGARNVLSATADLTGIAFLTDARRLSPVISRMRIETSSRTDAEWDLDYDVKKGRMTASTALLNYRFGSFTVGGGDAFLQTPAETAPANPLIPSQRFNQLRVLLGYGHPDKRGFTGAANIGFDAHLGFLQYASIQTAYNWDCCGFNIEYRRFALGSVRNENQFRFTFALANIGALGNLRRQERLF